MPEELPSLAFFRSDYYIVYPLPDEEGWMLSHEPADDMPPEQISTIEAKGGRRITQDELFS